MRWLLLLAVLSTGCGWYPFPYKTGPYTVRSGCIEAHADFPIDQKVFEHDVILARLVLDDMSIVKSADFCNEFKDVPIAISHNWHVADGHTGYYSRLRGILLGGGGGSLAHEFIHEVDTNRNFNICTSSHCGWQQRGYFDADNEYFASSWDLRDGSKNWTPHPYGYVTEKDLEE